MEFEPDETNQTDQGDQEVRQYLISHHEFGILDAQLNGLLRHHCADTMKLIRKSILKSLSMSKKTGTFAITLRADWNMQGFLEYHYGGGGERNPRSLLTVTGNCCDAQMASVESYLRQTWPSYTFTLIDALEESIFPSHASQQEQKGMLRSYQS